MNDFAADKKKRKILIPSLVLVGVVLVGGFVLSKAGLDKALVKQKLDESIVNIQERARERGRDVAITYGDVEVAGNLLNKHVVVQKLVVTVKQVNRAPMTPGQTAKIDSVIISTDEMAIYPRSADLSSATFSLAKPINVAGENAPDKSLLKMESNTPIAVTVSQKTENNVPYTVVSHDSPTQIVMTYLHEEKAEGTEDATPTMTPVYQTMTMNVEAGSGFESKSATDGSGLGVANTHYKKITFVPQHQPDNVIEIAGITSSFSNSINEKKLNEVKVTNSIGPITAKPELLPYAPILINVDFAFEGAGPNQPADAAAANASAPAQPKDVTITLNKLEISTKDSALSANANFVASPTDILPVGSGQIKLTNVPFVITELRKNHLLTADVEARYFPLVELVAGAPIATLQDLDIPVKRDRGGAFQIGKTTFESCLQQCFSRRCKLNQVRGSNDYSGTGRGCSGNARSSRSQWRSSSIACSGSAITCGG